MNRDGPFNPVANPDLYVPRIATEAALDELEWAIEDGEDVVALLGPAGIGKTLLLRLLARRLRDRFRCVTLTYPLLDADELWRMAGEALAEGPGGSLPLSGAPQEPADALPVALLIDDADALPAATARAVIEQAQHSQGQLRVIFAALSRARASRLLGTAENAAVEIVRLDDPMSEAETTEYIETRLQRDRAPAADAARFSVATIGEIHRRARGIPARVNQAAVRVLAPVGRDGDAAAAPAPTRAREATGARNPEPPTAPQRREAGQTAPPPSPSRTQGPRSASPTSAPRPSPPKAEPAPATLAKPPPARPAVPVPKPAIAQPASPAPKPTPRPPATPERPSTAPATTRTQADPRRPLQRPAPLVVSTDEPSARPSSPEPPPRQTSPAAARAGRAGAATVRRSASDAPTAAPTRAPERSGRVAPSASSAPAKRRPIPPDPFDVPEAPRQRAAEVPPTASRGWRPKAADRAAEGGVALPAPDRATSPLAWIRTDGKWVVVGSALAVAVSLAIALTLTGGSDAPAPAADGDLVAAERFGPPLPPSTAAERGLPVPAAPTALPPVAAPPPSPGLPSVAPAHDWGIGAEPAPETLPGAAAGPSPEPTSQVPTARTTPPAEPATRAAPPPLTVARRTPTPAPAPEPPPPARHAVNINARPWASIQIDGIEFGETPLGEVELEEGSHDFVARMPDGRVVKRTVEVNRPGLRIVFP